MWQAPIEYYVIDDPTMSVRRSVRRMTVAQEQLDIYFGGAEPPGLKSGDLLQASGVRVGNRVAAPQGSIQGSTVAAAACTTTGVQNMAILLVTFPGIPAPNITPRSVYDIYFANDGTRSVNGYW